MSSGGSTTKTTGTGTSQQSSVFDSESRINPFLANKARYQIQNINRMLGSDQYQDPSMYPGMGNIRNDVLQERLQRAQSGGYRTGKAASDYFVDLMEGKHSSPFSNPYLRDVADQVAMGSEQGVNSRYGKGRFGSGAFANAMADARSDVYSQIYSNAYERGEDRRANAARFAPYMTQLEDQNLQVAEGVGAAYEDDEYNRWKWPLDRESYRTAQLSGSPLALERYVSGTSDTEGTSTTRNRARSTKDFDWIGLVGALL